MMNREVHLLHLLHRNQLQPITAQHPAPPIKNVHNFFHLPNINGYFSIIYNEISAACCHNLVVLCQLHFVDLQLESAVFCFVNCMLMIIDLKVQYCFVIAVELLLFCVCCHCCWPIATIHQCPHFWLGTF
jgi:hypothetical protein